ncbi:Cysteine/O-acetylserine efflux protein [Aquimixticola soesokkakensis]|uniref:Cysteine/O-acetylserine efflux protein n=1 Tax=Aquimixticola soesokkakensis TaxID=1519096 RepID=A0A1Y5S3W5_9RHOB|nr:LysE family translocator [Aquimixticola soesokkakensis]SLN31785.1 Cysteine/O-acetylserine efflux protein [Aquimixticola soesokkakensis]
MTYALAFALLTFTFVSTITPGPNNLMLMASGANFGYRRSLPHMAGVTIGFTTMVALIGLGLGEVFTRWPQLHTVLKGLALIYMLWLAWKIAHASAPKDKGPSARPMRFLTAVSFQWVNPKAWAMGLTAIAAYAPDATWQSALWVAAAFGLVSFPLISLWTIAGTKLRLLLTNARRLATFNWTMAGLLVFSLIPILTH